MRQMKTARRSPACTMALICCAALFVATPGRGAWPPDEGQGKPIDYSDPANWPNDPGWPGEWEAFSFAPKTSPNLDARTKRLGVGGSYDRAWARTQGDPRVIIAVLDSGIYWNSPDLVNKFFLNQGELPPPDDACQTAAHQGAANRVWDANGDGVFNVQDYTSATGHQQPAFATVCDPRVKAKGDLNKNGLLDPQDLLATFSDGKDDDQNGYVDDIAGWDFFHDDNDPYDDVQYGHGTGEAHDSSAEANNSIGDVGVCPRCRVIPLRVGDSFVADSSDFALAATYAVDLGVSVIQEALGSINNSLMAKWAIDYAYDNHVTVIASAADEDSFHQMFPGSNNHTVLVHAIEYNAKDLKDATNAFAFNNCTNYGAQLLLSIPGTSCSSEATGKGGGLAGLIYSAALQAALPAPPPLRARAVSNPPAGEPLSPADRVRRLTAEEVKQVLIGTVDTFYDPADSNNLMTYPSGPGFVRRFGYGRPNGRSAVDQVLSGALPPQVEIESPDWFEVLHVGRGPVTLTGRIALREPGDSYDFVLDWAPGVDPTDDKFKVLAHGELLSSTMSGAIAQLPVDQLQVHNVVPLRNDPSWQPDDQAHTRTLVLRLRATQRSIDPQRNGLTGEARRAVHVIADPDLLPAFPLRLEASVEASPKTADLLHNGQREIIVGDSAGYMHAVKADGTELPGWPVAVQPKFGAHQATPAWGPGVDPNGRPRPQALAAIEASPAIGDINGDGKPEVVVATADGAIAAIGVDGKMLPGFPVALPGLGRMLALDPRHIMYDGVFASPVLADLDKDGKLDVIIAAMDGNVYVWKGDGTQMPGFPVTVWDDSLPDTGPSPTRQRARLMGTPAVGDLNKDGVPDLVLPTNENYNNNGRVYAIDGRGNNAGRAIMKGWPVGLFSEMVLPVVGIGIPNSPAMADLDGDGVPEVVISGIAGGMTILRADGSGYKSRPSLAKTAFGPMSDAREIATVPIIASPSLGDIDNDGKLDLVMPTGGANVALSMLSDHDRVDYEMHLSAWDLTSGLQKPGFPRIIEDWLFFANPALADVDGDGLPEVISGSAGYWVHAWNAAGTEAPGFPHLTGGWILSSPAVGDLDGDGKLELIAATRQGFVYAWHLRGSSKGRIAWDSFHHDNYNTGNVATPLGQGGTETVGGCQAVPGGAGAGAGAGLPWGLLAAGAVLRRRLQRRGRAGSVCADRR